ncbi:MAG: helix-turn-helix domain-containing protein [Pseudomonadota bacterium]
MKVQYSCPIPALSPFIEAYVVVDDRDGELPMSPLQTVPMPFAALSVNFCERSWDSAGNRHPEVALLGLQTRVRHWVSGASTLFVMVLLTPAGVMTLFPRLGEHTGNALRDLSDLWGRSQTDRFREATASILSADGQLDRWAISMLSDRDPDAPSLVDALRCYGRPAAAASALDMSLRTFERRFRRELGVTPTELINLQRLQQSLKTTRRSSSHDVVDHGFADQSHEIRHWRRYLGTSPGRYRKGGASSAAHALESAEPGGAVFYL